MSSPVSHLATGYAIYRVLLAYDPKVAGLPRGTRLLTASLFSMAPDADFIAGWLAHDFPAYHNNVSHSFAFGAVVCLAAALAVNRLVPTIRRLPFWLFSFACYAGHILVDYATRGRGVMLFWPFLNERLSSPILLFSGVSWSKGFATTDHLWTLLNDAIYGAIAIGLAELWARQIRRRKARAA